MTITDAASPSILIIDDDPMVLMILENALAKAGYVVRKSSAGAEGLAAARMEPPALVFLDVVLPDGDGRDFCREIKSDPKLAGTYVILMSCLMTGAEEQAQGLLAGADGYMVKPLDTRELLARTEAILRIRRTEQALRESEERYRSLFSAMLNGFALYEAIYDSRNRTCDFRYVEINPAFETLTGLTREAVISRTMTEVLPNLDQDCLNRLIEVMETGTPIHYESNFEEFSKRFEILAYRPKNGQLALMFLDVTDRHRAEQALLERERLLNATQRLARVGGWEWNVVDQSLSWTEETYRIHGLEPANRPDSSHLLEQCLECCGTENGSRFRDALQHCIQEGHPFDLEMPFTGIDDRRLWVRMTAAPVWEGSRVVRVVGNIMDLTDRKQIEDRLRYLATTDELTGLWNRRKFMELLHREIERARRYGHGFTLLMLDIDHFKCINDSFGHAAGDRVLEHLAGMLNSALRTPDVSGRFGGEEFAVILPETGVHGAEVIAERLRNTIAAEQVHVQGGSISYTVSIGAATFASDTSSADDLLKRADDALYKAKQQGRNRLVLATDREATGVGS
ncbi:GGDEF domain-containing response regulator [Desulfonatronum parangueonense]